MCDKNSKETIISVVKDLANEVYTDVAKPTLKSVGNIISLPFKAIDAALTPLKKWIDTKNYNYEQTRQLLAEKLKNVEEEKIIEPEAYVAVPALQQLSYSYDSKDLREMYANLLASSMNLEKKKFVHPAFVDIIKQLTPDEAKLLKFVSKHPQQALIDVIFDLPNGGCLTEVHNFTNIAEEICENPYEICSYIENMERLKLIELPSDVILKCDEVYEPLINHPAIQAIYSFKMAETCEVRIQKRQFILTSFGKNFINICL